MESANSRLTRIGVFYDGNYLYRVSTYYAYHHPFKPGRISIPGLHGFIRNEVSSREQCSLSRCHIVDARYFRGRLPASEAEQRGILPKERAFEDVLVREGITTHFLPVHAGGEEKGIDVWLALEAYELALYKRFDVIVLVAGDGDFLPLVRKLNTIGTPVMLLAWEFAYVDQTGQPRETRTAQALLNEVTYPLNMHEVIDDGLQKNDPLVQGLFIKP